MAYGHPLLQTRMLGASLSSDLSANKHAIHRWHATVSHLGVLYLPTSFPSSALR